MKTTRPAMAPGSLLTALLLGLCTLLWGGGCGEADGPVRLSFPLQVSGKAAADLPTDSGYTVTLSKASLHLGPVYFFSGEPLFTHRLRPTLWQRLARTAGDLLLPRAWAHPGHYQEGEALGELLQSATVDLLAAGSTPLGTVSGVSGSYRSAQVGLGPDATSGVTVSLAGTAKKGTDTIEFKANLKIACQVKGIAVGAELDGGAGTMALSVDLGAWVERIDFAKLAGGSSPVTVAAGSQAENALQRGIENTSAFAFSWTPQQHPDVN